MCWLTDERASFRVLISRKGKTPELTSRPIAEQKLKIEKTIKRRVPKQIVIFLSGIPATRESTFVVIWHASAALPATTWSATQADWPHQNLKRPRPAETIPAIDINFVL